MSKVSALGGKKRTLVEAHTPPRHADGANVLPLRGLCPWSETVTEYDLNNLSLYVCLLDGEEQGASLEEMAEVVFKIDAQQNPDWARRVALSHLKRAQWMNDRMFPTFD